VTLVRVYRIEVRPVHRYGVIFAHDERLRNVYAVREASECRELLRRLHGQAAPLVVDLPYLVQPLPMRKASDKEDHPSREGRA